MSYSFNSILFAIACLAAPYGLPGELCAAERTGAVELELADSVTVANREYTLADVIIAEGSSGWRTKQLDAGVLGRSPRPGYVAHLTRTQISARLEALSPGILKLIRWKGASVVKVRSAGVNLSSTRLVKVARSHLEQVLADRFESYSVAPVDAARDLVVPKGELEFAASLGGRERAGKRTCVWVDISVAGRHYQSIPVWFEVESIQTVWVVSEGRGEREYLDASVLRREPRDVALLAEAPLGPDASLDSVRLTQAVVAGQVLTRSMVEPIPAVEKGELVTVHTQSGRVRLSTRAVALADGEIAQRITVQNRNRGESYAAVVVGEGEVAVDVH